MSLVSLINKFKISFQNSKFFKEWDTYVKNPEYPEEEIPDIYGGDWEEEKPYSPEEMINTAFNKIPHKGHTKGKEWEEIAKEHLKKELNLFLKEFSSKAKFKNNNLIIYRTLTTQGDNEELVKSFKDPSFKAGIYWSWKPEPPAPWGGRGRIATITGLVDIKSINVMKTLIKNLHPTLGEEEAEIELLSNSKVLAIQLNEGRKNILWKGKETVKASFKKKVLSKYKIKASLNFTNWIPLTDTHIKQEYEWEYLSHQKSSDFNPFPNLESFSKAVKKGKVIILTEAADRKIGNRSRTSSLEELKNLTGGYRFPRDVDRIVSGFKDNDSMPYPILLKQGNDLWVMSGNTRLDAAYILGITPKVLIVEV